MEMLQLAVRNILRNKRRTLLDMTAFIVCLSMIIFFVGLYRFRILDGVAKATRYRTGHVQIHQAGYDAVARKLPLNLNLPNYPEILRALEADSRVIMASERIRFFSYLSHGEQLSHSIVVAFAPEKEKKVSLLAEC